MHRRHSRLRPSEVTVISAESAAARLHHPRSGIATAHSTQFRLRSLLRHSATEATLADSAAHRRHSPLRRSAATATLVDSATHRPRSPLRRSGVIREVSATRLFPIRLRPPGAAGTSVVANPAFIPLRSFGAVAVEADSPGRPSPSAVAVEEDSMVAAAAVSTPITAAVVADSTAAVADPMRAAVDMGAVNLAR